VLAHSRELLYFVDLSELVRRDLGPIDDKALGDVEAIVDRGVDQLQLQTL